MTFKPRTRTLLTTIVAIGFCIAVLGGVFHWARQLKTRVAEQKLAIVEELLGGVSADEINYGFHVVDGRVVFESRNHGSEFILKKVLTPVNGADPKTFRDLGQQFPEHGRRVYYGADASSVFVLSVGPIRTLLADPASFRLLDPDGRFACDDSKVFYFGIEIEGADPKTFRRLEGDFSVDDDQAFLGHRSLAVDVATFRALSPGYIHRIWDNREVYQGDYGFEGWNCDDKHVYYGLQRIEQADAGSFEYLQYQYAKDAQHVYHDGELIEEADPQTFQIIGTKYLNFFQQTSKHPNPHGPMARDANHFYLSGWIVTREGPWTETATDRSEELEKSPQAETPSESTADVSDT